MATAELPGHQASPRLLRLHHGTDLGCATDLLQNGVDAQSAAAWNGSGEFWATTDHARAEWFARSHPNSPPACCFEFDLPEPVLQVLLQIHPLAARHHAPNDYEFLPPSHALLNQHMVNQQLVAVP
jgi:hypothetical protein